MKKLPIEKAKTIFWTLIFGLLSLAVFVSGYFFFSDPDLALWELTNRDKVRQLKQAYEQIVEETTIILQK